MKHIEIEKAIAKAGVPEEPRAEKAIAKKGAQEPRAEKAIAKPGVPEHSTIEEKPGEKTAATAAKSKHIELENETGAEKAQKESRIQRQMGTNWRRIRAVPSYLRRGTPIQETIEENTVCLK